MSGLGKIDRLPQHIREGVCQRLLDGESGARIIAWLHAQPEVLAVLDMHFGEEPINAQNLSNWRHGGYQAWLAKREKVETIKSLAAYCSRIAEAGGGTMNLPAAIAGGQIMEVLEDFDVDRLKELLKNSPETWLGVLEMLARLQRSKADELVAKQNERRLEQADRQLALKEKEFQRRTAELFLEWYQKEEARKIAESGASKAVKMDQLVLQMFGKKPEAEK